MAKKYENYKSKAERINENQEKLVNAIIEKMETKGLEWKRGWTPEMVSPRNPSSKTKYSGRNIMYLFTKALEKEYKDPRWVTYAQARSEGWQVKRGAKSTALIKYVFDKEVKQKNEKTGKIEKVKIEYDRPIPCPFNVFNAEDIEGIPELKFKPLEKNKVLEIAEHFIKSSKIPIVEVAQDRAFYSPSQDKIVLPLKNTFKSQDSYLATALHEMVHSTGKDLKRDLSGKFGTQKYAREELVAELGSVFLQGRLGIKLEDEHIENHSAYIQSWIKILKENPSEISTASKEASKASELLYGRFKEYLKEKNIEYILEESLDVMKNQEYWKIEWNEYGSDEKIKDYRGKIVTKEFLKELKDYDEKYFIQRNSYFKELELKGEKITTKNYLPYYKFKFTKITANGNTGESIRIDIGEGNKINEEEFKVIQKDLEKDNITQTKTKKRKPIDNQVEVDTDKQQER